jgi:maleylpyruvate isomerase
METEPADVEPVLDAVSRATRRLVATLSGFDETDLDSPSLLPSWTRRMIIGHLSYVASAYERATREAVAFGRATTYPDGPEERNISLDSLAGRSAAECLESFVRTSSELESTWRELPRSSWEMSYLDDPGRGRIGLARLVAQRLTELEVHHGDLGSRYGPSTWSEEFVEICLPLRIAWLPVHHRARVDADTTVEGSWLFRSPEGSWKVTASGSRSTAEQTTPEEAADVTMDGSGAALLAYLLGREPPSALSVHGDRQLFSRFKLGFPGP